MSLVKLSVVPPTYLRSTNNINLEKLLYMQRLLWTLFLLSVDQWEDHLWSPKTAQCLCQRNGPYANQVQLVLLNLQSLISNLNLLRAMLWLMLTSVLTFQSFTKLPSKFANAQDALWQVIEKEMAQLNFTVRSLVQVLIPCTVDNSSHKTSRLLQTKFQAKWTTPPSLSSLEKLVRSTVPSMNLLTAI